MSGGEGVGGGVLKACAAGKVILFGLLLLLLGLATFLSLSGCGSSETEVPILHTDMDYDALNKEVKNLTLSAFTKPEDRSLTDEEEHNLKVAAIKVQGLIAYKPDMYSNYFIAAKIAYLLDDWQTAISYAQQCISREWPPGTSQTFYVQTLAEAKYLESRSWFNLHDYQKAADSAQYAVRLENKSVVYRLAEARAEAQMHHDKSAAGILKDVLKLDPRNTEAKKLLDLIGR